MPTYPIGEKLRGAIDSLEEGHAYASWFFMLRTELTVPAKLIALGFSEDEVRNQMAALRSETVNNLVDWARQDDLDDREKISPALIVLSGRTSREVFDKAKELTRSVVARDRALGFSILMRDAGQAFPLEAIEIVLESFERENEGDVLEMLAYAAMHLRINSRAKYLKPLVEHPSAAVRRAVASSLGGEDDRQSISALIKLTRDSCQDVRNWATFSLGTLCHRNTAPIREALFSRLEDDHEETKFEAIFGLAVRKDPRILPVVKEALQGERVCGFAMEAAEELADPALYPLLQNLKLKWREMHSDHYLMKTLDSALEACHP